MRRRADVGMWFATLDAFDSGACIAEGRNRPMTPTTDALD